MPSGRDIYESVSGRKWAVIAATAAALSILFVLSVLTGTYSMSVPEMFQAMFYTDSVDPISRSVVWNTRLPRAVMGVVVGAALGIAGAEMQTILDNPLAEPYTLGISSAAAFGAGLAIVLGLGLSGAGVYTIPINAFVMSIVCCLVIYSIAKKRSADKTVLILGGVAMFFLFHALVSTLQYMGTLHETSALLFWTFGSLSRANWENIAILSAVLVLVLIVFVRDSWRLTSLKLGDTKAMSLGVNVNLLRRKVLIGVSVLTATAVSFTGTIGFVGLVGPHLARMVVGDDQRYFLPLSALVGALLLTLAYVVGKVAFPHVVFPIGIITSLIGVPFFMYLIIRKKGVLF